MFEIAKSIHAALGTESTLVFVLTVAITVGLLGGAVAWLVDKGYKNEKAKAEVRTENPGQSKTESLTLPLVVEVVVSQDKQLHIENNGAVQIKDVEMYATEYWFDKQAYTKQQLVIERFQKLGAPPLFQIPMVSPRTRSTTIDLTKIPLLRFTTVTDGKGNINANVSPEARLDGMLKHYCLRITFRDDRSGEKYVIYKVTGSIEDMPSFYENPDSVGFYGSPDFHFFIQDIPKVIINHQRILYKDDNAKEMP